MLCSGLAAVKDGYWGLVTLVLGDQTLRESAIRGVTKVALHVLPPHEAGCLAQFVVLADQSLVLSASSVNRLERRRTLPTSRMSSTCRSTR